MESRSSYGYYGCAGGFTGENPPKAPHKSGWTFSDYVFRTSQHPSCNLIQIRAMDYEHAVKQAQKWARKEGFTIIECVEGR